MNWKPALASALKITTVIVASVAGLILIMLGIGAILRPLSSSLFGTEIVTSGMFYVAVFSFSLITYMILLVVAMRMWEAIRVRVER